MTPAPSPSEVSFSNGLLMIVQCDVRRYADDTIHISGLRPTTTADDIMSVCGRYGRVAAVHMGPGTCDVRFQYLDSGLKARDAVNAGLHPELGATGLGATRGLSYTQYIPCAQGMRPTWPFGTCRTADRVLRGHGSAMAAQPPRAPRVTRHVALFVYVLVGFFFACFIKAEKRWPHVVRGKYGQRYLALRRPQLG